VKRVTCSTVRATSAIQTEFVQGSWPPPGSGGETKTVAVRQDDPPASLVPGRGRQGDLPTPGNAADGKHRPPAWGGSALEADPQWIQVDLGQTTTHPGPRSPTGVGEAALRGRRTRSRPSNERDELGTTVYSTTTGHRRRRWTFKRGADRGATCGCTATGRRRDHVRDTRSTSSGSNS